MFFHHILARTSKGGHGEAAGARRGHCEEDGAKLPQEGYGEALARGSPDGPLRPLMVGVKLGCGLRASRAHALCIERLDVSAGSSDSFYVAILWWW